MENRVVKVALNSTDKARAHPTRSNTPTLAEAIAALVAVVALLFLRRKAKPAPT